MFLAYIDQNGALASSYNPGVIGFKYFSAQGRGKPDAGFAYRYAYFGNKCPAGQPLGPRDCGIIRSQNTRLLSGGTLWKPGEWTTIPASQVLTRSVASSVAGRNPGASSAFLDQQVRDEMEKELLPNPSLDFSGDTTD